MNFTAIIAVLERKGIITRDEGEKLVEFLNNKPQSTLLADAAEQIKELVDEELPVISAKVKPAIAVAKSDVKKVAKEAKQVAEQAAKTAEDTIDAVKDEAAKVAEEVASDVAATEEKAAPAEPAKK